MEQLLQQIRDLDADTRHKLLITLFMEYQLTAHINTMQEEERLASLNMQEQELVERVYVACYAVAHREGINGPVYVAIPDVYKLLEEEHFLLPPHVVRAILKTAERHHMCTEVSDGIFRIFASFG